MNSQNLRRSRQGGDGVAPLAVVRAAFDARSADPVPWPVQYALGQAGLAKPVDSWGQLRALLCDPTMPSQMVETVWVWLVRRARLHDAQAAVLLCAGMALPMLGGMVSRFSDFDAHDRHDAEAQVLTAFLAEIGRVDLERAGVWSRLRWAAFAGGRWWVTRTAAAARAASGLTTPAETEFAAEQRPVGIAPDGHPELLLVQAVVEGVITETGAALIAATRLEGRSLAAVAAEWGQPYNRVLQRRWRAERRLVAWLGQRLIDTDPDHEVEADAIDAVARGRVFPKPMSENGVSSATTRCTETAGVPAHPAPVEVTRRCA
ncbi:MULTISPECIES: hypothetical protein [unclassified Nocardia]|uniref:hypothetical protein n=1 Tax=unclassified Nocardia TaxID=2637762 RepID=UPI001CE43988|nr:MULTISPECIES: hypothetical protein [unclassified Nocardia]